MDAEVLDMIREGDAVRLPDGRRAQVTNKRSIHGNCVVVADGSEDSELFFTDELRKA